MTEQGVPSVPVFNQNVQQNVQQMNGNMMNTGMMPNQNMNNMNNMNMNNMNMNNMNNMNTGQMNVDESGQQYVMQSSPQDNSIEMQTQSNNVKLQEVKPIPKDVTDKRPDIVFPEEQDQILYTEEQVKANNMVCRHCLQGYEAGNDFISPCACQGSLKYVHRHCLDQWRIISPNPKSFYHCDICNTKYQFKMVGDSSTKLKNYIKYGCAVGSDIFLIFLGFFILVGICSIASFLVDATLSFAITNKIFGDGNATSYLPFIYLGAGFALFFFCFGCFTIVLIFVLLVIRLVGLMNKGKRKVDKFKYNNYQYKHMKVPKMKKLKSHHFKYKNSWECLEVLEGCCLCFYCFFGRSRYGYRYNSYGYSYGSSVFEDCCDICVSSCDDRGLTPMWCRYFTLRNNCGCFKPGVSTMDCCRNCDFDFGDSCDLGCETGCLNDMDCLNIDLDCLGGGGGGGNDDDCGAIFLAIIAVIAIVVVCLIIAFGVLAGIVIFIYAVFSISKRRMHLLKRKDDVLSHYVVDHNIMVIEAETK